MADFEVIFVDIGKGDSTLIHMPGDQWALIDVFRAEGEGIDLFKLLDDQLPAGANGKRRLEYLIITHAHDDHVRGLADLVERYEIGAIWAPMYETETKLGDKFEEFKAVMKANKDIVVIPQGSRTPIAQLGEDESVTVRCFSPPGYIDVDEKLTEQEQRDKVHEYCGVFKFDYNGFSVMFTGDSDLTCWQRVISYYENVTDENDLTVVKSDVLHASHHGSYTFFREADEKVLWLDGLECIEPSQVVVSVGAGNKYGHPHKDAMDAYRDKVGDANVLDTEHSHSIVIEVEADGSSLARVDDGEFADAYGWDDDDDGGGGGSRGGSPSGPSGSARSKTRTRLDNSSAA